MYRGFFSAVGRNMRTSARNTFNSQFSTTTTTTTARFNATSTRSTAAQSEITITARTATTTTTSTTAGSKTTSNTTTGGGRSQSQNNSKTTGSSQQQSAYSKSMGGVFASEATSRLMMSKLSSRTFGSLALAAADSYLLLNYSQTNGDDA